MKIPNALIPNWVCVEAAALAVSLELEEPTDRHGEKLLVTERVAKILGAHDFITSDDHPYLEIIWKDERWFTDLALTDKQFEQKKLLIQQGKIQ